VQCGVSFIITELLPLLNCNTKNLVMAIEVSPLKIAKVTGRQFF